MPSTTSLEPRYVSALADAAYAVGTHRGSASAAADMLAALGQVSRHDAASVFAWDPIAREHRAICVQGYDEATIQGLKTKVSSGRLFARLHSARTPLRIDDPPYDFRQTDTYHDVIRPAGFDEGMSTALFLPDGSYTGMLHLSAQDRWLFHDRVRDTVALLSPLAARVADLSAPVFQGAHYTQGYDGAVIDVLGTVRPVMDQPMTSLRTDTAFLTLVREILNRRTSSVRGLWPHPAGGWREVHIRRVPSLAPGQPPTAFVSDRQRTDVYGLTPRELEILTAITMDRSNAQIARRCFISVRTVTTHVERILSKLDCDSRAGAAVAAVREGLVRLDLRKDPRNTGP